MARPRKPSEKKQTNALLDAISFLSCVTSDEGTPYQTHILLSNGTAVAYNDILSAGIIINEEIYAAPNASIFRKALSKCGEAYTLSIDGSKIIVKSGSFKAIVPCIDPGLLTSRTPDAIVASLDDKFKEALSVIDILKPEPNAEKVHLVAFLINGQSLINTDGKIIIEYWHGLELPTISVPKIVIPCITGSNKKLTSLGLSNTSVTFYFDDKSWIKSQFYDKPYPIEMIPPILNKNCNASTIPVDFYKGLEAVVPFSENGSVYFERDKICSHKVSDAGATFDVSGLPNGPIYTAKYLSMIKPLVEKIDFAVSANGSVHSNNHSGYLLFWFGNQVRGVIAGHG